ncbi:MAG: sulfotransferase [Granulosicoccus sp.]|nr:sulfotransferase [Granulosicoccus sp.]
MSSLVPVMVRTFGRTGSTLLMQILGTSERILFERQYPFEHRYLTYVYQLTQQIQAPVVTDDTWNNSVLFQGRKSVVGCLPYVKTPLLDRERLALKSIESLWEVFSAEMLESAGLSPDQTCFYAEKTPHKVSDFVTEHLGGRTVYLLRDPRDELVSIRSFNQKRGFRSFGWSESDTDLSYARKMCTNRRTFMRDLLNSEISDRRYHIRYEDLITNGEKEVSRLSAWLGEPLNFAKAMKNKNVHQQHMTARNFKSSVERWRRELGEDVQELFADELGQELVELGYAV